MTMSGSTWRRHIALGLVHYMAYPETMEGAPVAPRLVNTAYDPDFSLVNLTHMPDARDRAEVRRIVETAGLRVVFSAAPPLAHSGLSLSSADKEDRVGAIEFATGLIDEAVELHAELVFFISGPDPGPAERPQALPRLQDSLEMLCNYGKRQSGGALTVTIEPADREVDHRELLGPFAEAFPLAEMVRRVDPSFGVVVDLSHCHQLDEDPEVVLRQGKGLIKHIHLANAVVDNTDDPLYGDKHPRIGIAGGRVGVSELSRFVHAAINSGAGRGPTGKIDLALELRTQPGEDPELVVAAGKRAFFDAWAMS